jgi:hypothetical protein
VLAARGQAQFLGSAGAKLQNPFHKPLGVKPFARMCDAVNGLAIWVAGVCFIEPAQRVLETLRITRLKIIGHRLVLFQNTLPAQGRFSRKPAVGCI